MRLSKSTFKLYATIVLLLTSFSLKAQKGDIVGIPTTGAKGVTISVEEILKISKEAEKHPQPIKLRKEPEFERHPKKNPDAPSVSRFPDPNETGRIFSQNGSLGTQATQTIYSNFLATTLSEGNSVPPDNNGDIGTTQVCTVSNGRLKFYTKNTVCQTAQTTVTTTSNTALAAPVFNSTLDAFFTPVTTAGISDPHVRFDRATNRWFIVAIDVAATSNKCVIAVSSGATVVSGASFTFFSFVYDALLPVPPSPYAGGFFDYPTLGVDANALYIGGRMFNAAGTAYTGASLFVVRKSSILGAGPIVTTAFHQIGTASAGIYTPQGVDNDDPTATVGYVIGVDNAVFSRLDIHRITNPGTTPTASAAIALTVPTTSTPLNQVNNLAANTLDINDDRLFAGMIRKNKITGVSSLWTAHAIAVTTAGVGASTGAGRRNGARWYQIDNLNTTPTLTQSGTLFDAAATNPRGFTFPSIATSGQGHSVIGFSTASLVNFIDCGVAGRYRTDATGTLQPFVLATSASTTYAPSFDASPFRWGDYSQVGIDPSDDMTMWTFQEYCNAANSWGMRAIQLKAPPPAAPTALGTIACGTGPVVGTRTTAITLNGTSSSNSEFYDPGTGYANRLAVTTTGTGASISNLVFVNPTQITFKIVWPTTLSGTTQTLTITNPDCQSVTTTYTLPTGCALVPLNLLSFTGKGIDKRVQLDWVTSNEINSDYIVLEKSTDKINFNEIARLNSIGINGGPYQYFDNNPADINYYRLKQVDVNGEFKYSNIITVRFSEKLGFSIYPNPANASLTLEYATGFKNGMIHLIDASGKRVLSKKVLESNKTILDISIMPSGIYIVEMTNDKGLKFQERLVIEKK